MISATTYDLLYKISGFVYPASIEDEIVTETTLSAEAHPQVKNFTILIRR